MMNIVNIQEFQYLSCTCVHVVYYLLLHDPPQLLCNHTEVMHWLHVINSGCDKVWSPQIPFKHSGLHSTTNFQLILATLNFNLLNWISNTAPTLYCQAMI